MSSTPRSMPSPIALRANPRNPRGLPHPLRAQVPERLYYQVPSFSAGRATCHQRLDRNPSVLLHGIRPTTGAEGSEELLLPGKPRHLSLPFVGHCGWQDQGGVSRATPRVDATIPAP